MSDEFPSPQRSERLLSHLGSPSRMITYPGVDSQIDAVYSQRGLRGTLAELDHELLRDFTASDLGCLVFQTRTSSGEARQYYVGAGVLASPSKRIDGATIYSTQPLTEVPDSMTRDFVVGGQWPFGFDGSETLESIARPWSYANQTETNGMIQGTNSPTAYGREIIEQLS